MNTETSLLEAVPEVHPEVCITLPKHRDSSSTKPFSFKIFKIEAQWSTIKSYVSFETPSLDLKIESISPGLQKTLKSFQEREDKTSEIFQQNTTLLKNELFNHKLNY